MFLIRARSVWMLLAICAATTSLSAQQADPARQAEERAARRAKGAELYAKYCSACHGAKGEGYVADHANALRTRSFIATASPIFLEHAIRYGRPGTAMAAYHQAFGGPLADADISAVVEHIRVLGDYESIDTKALPRLDPSHGDASRGERVYREHCVQCHGTSGKRGTASRLDDPLFLLTSSPSFLRYAIEEGREGTPMQPFRGKLTPAQMDDVTVYLRSRSTRWIEPRAVRLKTTSLGDAVINPSGKAPVFGSLRNDLYVAVPALKQAFDQRARLILLDARAPSAWAAHHIRGAVPLPYYDIDRMAGELPRDGTWIVAYCECPTALATKVITGLRAKGFTNTAVLDEGLAGWVARRYPVASGILPETPPTSEPQAAGAAAPPRSR